MVRPTQQSSTKRKRKSNDLIWARDGDHKNAQEHPAYLLENNCKDGAPSNDKDKVWVEWSSNGTVACIPKSRISTTGLSSRRSRHNNNGRKQSGNNNEQPTTNNNTKHKRAPSTKTKRSSVTVNKSNNNSSNTTTTIPDHILVEGCGMSELNGTYNRLFHFTLPDHYAQQKDSPVYSKKGKMEEKVVDFVIYWTSHHRQQWHWYIAQWKGRLSNYDIIDHFYVSTRPKGSKLTPPANGWQAHHTKMFYNDMFRYQL